MCNYRIGSTRRAAALSVRLLWERKGDDLPAAQNAVSVSDEPEHIKKELIHCADELAAALIVTTGGTGFSPRDNAPEATMDVVERPVPGIAEAMRYHSLYITPRGMLSRAVSGIRGRTLIVNLPGSPKAVKENLEYILPTLDHGLAILVGDAGECARK